MNTKLLINTLAKKAGVSEKEVIPVFNQALKLTKDFFNKEAKDFTDKENKYLEDTMKNMLNIKENYTLKFLNSGKKLKEFIESEFTDDNEKLELPEEECKDEEVKETMTSGPLVKVIPTLKPKEDKKVDEGTKLTKSSPTIKGSWDEIKAYLIKNYDKYNYIFFINPDTNQESMILPSNYHLDWFKRATPNDLGRISIR